MRLVEDEPGPGRLLERVDVLRQDVVVDDHPIEAPLERRALLDDVRRRTRVGDGDLARPVALHRRGTDDEIRAVWCDVPQRDDRLPRFAEAHVVGQDRASAAEQERDAFDLMREQPVRQLSGLAERRVWIVWRQSEQPGEGVGLRVEHSIHRYLPGGFAPSAFAPQALRRDLAKAASRAVGSAGPPAPDPG